ncbi:hypothetical protein CGLO_18177 [Colletotrichum gloeosporioides Cg-14]|uniref:Uncharacterized protein n=1 Tax=Colletotrichum gloeosporioides (strain Cg-14) TaxID=1237896 RepID=T0KV57_COLGC|nr:hypothetical protein CGLO_18177 [Colletotrichum gloeosporioides Cg-14]
MFVASTQNLQH